MGALEQHNFGVREACMDDCWRSRRCVGFFALNTATCVRVQQSRRLTREVVEFARVGWVCWNDRKDMSVVVLVIALALQLRHVAAADDRVGGEQADAAQHKGAGVALALLGVVERRVAAVGIPTQ